MVCAAHAAEPAHDAADQPARRRHGAGPAHAAITGHAAASGATWAASSSRSACATSSRRPRPCAHAGIELLCEPQTSTLADGGSWSYAYFVEPDGTFVALSEAATERPVCGQRASNRRLHHVRQVALDQRRVALQRRQQIAANRFGVVAADVGREVDRRRRRGRCGRGSAPRPRSVPLRAPGRPSRSRRRGPRESARAACRLSVVVRGRNRSSVAEAR